MKHLKADDVVDKLITKHLIGESNRQQLFLPVKTRQEKNRIIVEELRTGGPDTYKKFCEILKESSATKHIADKLEKGTYLATYSLT